MAGPESAKGRTTCQNVFACRLDFCDRPNFLRRPWMLLLDVLAARTLSSFGHGCCDRGCARRTTLSSFARGGGEACVTGHNEDIVRCPTTQQCMAPCCRSTLVATLSRSWQQSLRMTELWWKTIDNLPEILIFFFETFLATNKLLKKLRFMIK